jgi:hypothetical protein
MHSKRRHEVASSGLDDFFANLTGHNTGLRIPAAAVGAISGEPIDYLFLLHMVDVSPGDELAGLATFLSIAAPQTISESTVLYPFERQVESILWKFPDTFYEFILTEDKVPPSGGASGAFDSDSFVFEDSQSPALLYETVHFPAVPPAPGYLGLDDYTAPGIRGSVVLTVRDLRWPWTDLQSFPSLRLAPNRNTRFRFYLRIRQTNPATRPELPIDDTMWAKFPDVFTPEDGYLVASQKVLGEDTAQWWRCAGRIIYQSGKNLRSFQPGESSAAPPEC